MLKINLISDINYLPINKTILTAIEQSLLAPFSTKEEADSVWNEINCQLWFIENLDQIPDDVDDKDLLIYSLENIEQEENIGDEYWLVLSVINSSGQGVYVLFNQSIKEDLIKELGLNYGQ